MSVGSRHAGRIAFAAAVVALAFQSYVVSAVRRRMTGPAEAGHYVPSSLDERNAGLQWRFVRIKYHYTIEGTQQSYDFTGEPWFIDGPAAEQNLSRRGKTGTTIQGEDPIVPALDEKRPFENPWIYFFEPGFLRVLRSQGAPLPPVPLPGGTAMFDEFHGPIEWENLARELKRVFPNREIVEVPKDHPVFSCFYKIDSYPQVPGIGSFMQGRTWEKGGFVPHLRTILDDTGRPMM